VATIVRLTGQHFSREEQDGTPLEIVLTSRTSSAWPHAAHPMAPPRGTAGAPPAPRARRVASMDLNTSAAARDVCSWLRQVRADAARSRLLASLRRRPVGWRAALALALVRLGRRLAGRGGAIPRTA